MKRKTQIIVDCNVYEKFIRLLDSMNLEHRFPGLYLNSDLIADSIIVEFISNKDEYEAIGYYLFTLPWRKQVRYDQCKFGTANEI